MKLTRHSEWKQTNDYTDPQSLSFFVEMEKLAAQTLAPILAPNSGKTGQNGGNPVQTSTQKKPAEIVAIDDDRMDLGKVNQPWEKVANGAQGGTRTPMRLSTGF